MIAYDFYFGWFLYNLICLILLINLPKQIKYNQRKIFIGFYSIFFLLFALFGSSISPDFFSYQKIVKIVSHAKNPITHIEDIYVNIIHIIGDKFTLFQLIIYIPQFISFYLVSTKLNLKNVALYLYVFAIIGLYQSIIGRFYLYNVTFLLGIILIGNRQYFIGVIILILSGFLHKLGFYLTPLIILFLIIPLNLNKKNVRFILILFLFLSISVRFILQNHFAEFINMIDETEGHYYIEKKEGYNSTGSIIWQFIYAYQQITTIILSIYILLKTNKHYVLSCRLIDKIMYQILFWLTLFVCFYYMLGLPDITIGSRILSITTIPLAYFICLLQQYNKISVRQKNFFIIWSLVYLMFNNAYIIGVSHINLK